MKKVKFFIIFFICLNSVNLFSQQEYEDIEESSELIYEEQTLEITQTQVQTQAQTIQQPQQAQTVQQTQPDQQTQPVQYASGGQNITLLTWDIVNLIQNSGKSLNDLNFYVSKPFSMVISEQYDAPKVEIQNGTLIMPDRGQTRAIVFTGNQPGKLHGFPVSGSRDTFEVIFQSGGRDVALKFNRNRQNYFELFSAVIDTRPYTLHSDTDVIQLAISSNITVGGNEVQAYAQAGRSGLVEGRGSLGKNQIIAYIKRQNTSVNDALLNKLIDTYIEEAAFENINHDIAIAQMLYATSFLKGSKYVSSHNYGGLLELPSWNGKFANMTEGVRAHIQHIKGYASTTMNNKQIVDPRYYLLINLKYLGTVKTFDQLYARWVSPSASADYKKSVERILDGLYR
jgi:hypothetical protein